MKVQNASKYRDGGFARPSDDISPYKKQNDPKYSKQWAQFIYAEFSRGTTGINQKLMTRIDFLRSYAYGQQNPDIYKPFFSIDDNSSPVTNATSSSVDADTEDRARNKGRKHFMDVDFNTIFSPAPKYLNHLIGKLSQYQFDASVNAMDPNSGAEKEEAKWRRWAKSRIKDSVDKINKIRGIESQESGELFPKTLEELHMFDQMGQFKTQYEVAMEKALAFTANLSEQKEIQKKVIADIVTANVGAFESYVDKYDGFVKYSYVDPKDLLIEYSSKDMFDKSSYFGYIKYFRLADIREKFPNLDEETIRGMARNHTGLYGNPDSMDEAYYESDNRWGYDSFNIPVLKVAWITTDRHFYMTREGKDGSEITSRAEGDLEGNPRIRNNKNRRTYPLYIKTVYEANWVIDTEHVFDYGRMHDVPFDPIKKEVRLPIHVYRIKGKSIIDSMIPMLDQIHMTYLKLQNAIAKAPPTGLKIDIGKTKKVTMNGMDFGPLDLVKLYTQSGHMIYDSSIVEGQVLPTYGTQDPGKAIEQLTGGSGTAIAEAMQSWEMAFTAISEITGIDRASTSSKQAPRTSAAETKLAAAGTLDTLQPIMDAWIHIVKRGAECASLRIQSRCLLDESPYKTALGEVGVMAIKQAGGTPPAHYGIMITPRPTQEEQADVLVSAREALKSGILTFSQYMFVKDVLSSGGGLNYAQQYIAYQEQQFNEKQAESARAAQEADTEKQLMTAEQKVKGEIAKDQNKSQLKIAEITHQADQDIRVERATAALNPSPQPTI